MREHALGYVIRQESRRTRATTPIRALNCPEDIVADPNWGRGTRKVSIERPCVHLRRSTLTGRHLSTTYTLMTAGLCRDLRALVLRLDIGGGTFARSDMRAGEDVPSPCAHIAWQSDPFTTPSMWFCSCHTDLFGRSEMSHISF